MSKIIKELFSPIVVGSFDQLFDEGDVRFASFKSPTAAQHQCLIDTIFEVSVRRFDVAVFVGTSRVRAFRFAVVVTHQRRISFGEFTLARVVAHSSSQGIASMPLRNTAEFPEGLLDAGTQRFKRFGKAQRHTFGIAVRQHTVVKRVVESLSGDLHAEFIAHREVTGGDSSRMMLLIKEDRLSGTMQTAPLAHASLKSATRGIRKLSFVSLLQPLKQRLRFELRFQFEPLLDLGPDTLERVAASAIIAIANLLCCQSVAVAILACRFIAHFRHPC
jgi:hypothetical protein